MIDSFANKDLVSIVLVGIGGYGVLYVDEIFEDMEKGLCELVGIVDPAAQFSPRYEKIKAAGIPFYDSLEAFYKEDTAMLCCIAAPIQFHTPYTVCALRHGSHVLCEKPLSGDWTDGIALKALAEQEHRFIMSGYQWSHSDAILALKRDILAGKFGAPKHLRTRILWPRRKSYFNRGSGWAGKRYASDGTPIFDSVANNAAAHYLHNMLFVLGDEMDTAAMPETIDAELLRANPIENFDSCVIRMHMRGGVDAVFIASHCTKETVDPVFTYEFENGTVTYAQDDSRGIVATFADGEVKYYGDPFADSMNKVRYAIQAINTPRNERFLPCTVKTATPHARCIGAIKDVPITTIPDAMLEDVPGDMDAADTLRVVLGLHHAMDLCYERGCLITELNDAESAPLRTILEPVKGIVIE